MLVVGIVLPSTPVGKFPWNRPHRQCIVAEVIMKLDQPGKNSSRSAHRGSPGKIRRWGSRSFLDSGNALTVDVDGTRWEHREGGVHRGDPPFQHVFHLRSPLHRATASSDYFGGHMN